MVSVNFFREKNDLYILKIGFRGGVEANLEVFAKEKSYELYLSIIRLCARLNKVAKIVVSINFKESFGKTAEYKTELVSDKELIKRIKEYDSNRLLTKFQYEDIVVILKDDASGKSLKFR